MIEIPLRISSPRKVTSPSHTFSSGRVHILARDVKYQLETIYLSILGIFLQLEESQGVEMSSSLPTSDLVRYSTTIMQSVLIVMMTDNN